MTDIKKFEITLEKLINLLFFFVIGTTLFLIQILFKIPDFKFKESISFTILIGGIMCYEFVIITLGSYYVIKGKKSLENHYIQNKKKYLYSIAFILLLTFSISDALFERSWLILFRDLSITILTVYFGPKIFEKINNPRKEESK